MPDQVELVPGGHDRPVTAGESAEYILRVANFRLNAQIKRAADAFQRGLEKIIAREWVAMFNEGELQVRLCAPEWATPAPALSVEGFQKGTHNKDVYSGGLCATQ